MNDGLKQRLVSEFGLNEEQVGKLAAEGVVIEADLALLSDDKIKHVTGCGLIAAIKIHAAFAPVPLSAPPPPSGEATLPLDAEIPEGTKPSPAQVNNFASALGMDQNMFSMFMMMGVANQAGVGMDLSGMIAVPQVVAGYTPKYRSMFWLAMEQIENRVGVPIVVINGNGSINRELTVEYIMGLEEGRDQAENNIYYDSTGAPYEVIAVGVDAESIHDADPLDSTRALQKSGMGIGRVNWTGVSDEVRQSAFFAVKTGEINPKNDIHLAWLRDHVKPGSNRLVFQGQAPDAINKFNEARRTGTLPNLRVMLTRGPRKTEIMPRRRRTTPRDLTGLGKGGEEDDSHADSRF